MKTVEEILINLTNPNTQETFTLKEFIEKA